MVKRNKRKMVFTRSRYLTPTIDLHLELPFHLFVNEQGDNRVKNFWNQFPKYATATKLGDALNQLLG